ncbi:MAG: hypothetical protein IJV72_06875, partial [Clostridia bacterium]|nr:hypothetical protein [Clostridia bacterium]
VVPVMTETFSSPDVLFYHAKNVAKECMNLSNGDKIVITGGLTNGHSGNTDIIKIETIVDKSSVKKP